MTSSSLRASLRSQLLPGRSDDAVRNRWSRLQEQPGALPPAGGRGGGARVRNRPPISAPISAPISDDLALPPGKARRLGWTAAEDAIIEASVNELGTPPSADKYG